MSRTMPTIADRLKKAAASGRRGDPVTAREQLALIDADRRKAARLRDPAFPADWGEPRGKYFEVPVPGGEQRVVPIMPERGPHLTVWRFDGFEATATFDRLAVTDHPENWRNIGIRKFVVLQEAKEPPQGGWERAGATDNLSNLWTRPVRKGGRDE